MMVIKYLVMVVLAMACVIALPGCLSATESETTFYNKDGTIDRVVKSSESVVSSVIESTKDKVVFVNDQSWLGGVRVVPPGSSGESPMGELEAVVGKRDRQLLTVPMGKIETANAPDAVSGLCDLITAARAGEISVSASGIGSNSPAASTEVDASNTEK